MHIFFLQYLELHCNCSSKALFYYHLRFLLTATTVPRHPADTASARTKIAIFVLSPVSHSSDATSVSNSPKTGDNTNIAIFVLALAVSAGCLGTVVTVKRKRK